MDKVKDGGSMKQNKVRELIEKAFIDAEVDERLVKFSNDYSQAIDEAELTIRLAIYEEIRGKLLMLVCDDAHAITYQTLGQYRKSLVDEINIILSDIAGEVK